MTIDPRSAPLASPDVQSARGVRAFAFFLPQFHPIPENDAAWGAGFTEWRNVDAARPLFRGHDQPIRPGELGRYDLRDPDTREHQAVLARAAGLAGFCWYHYWFEGKRVLREPFDAVLSSGEPDYGFMLCWANEPWTRAWDGATGSTIIEQHYSPEDDLAHIRYLCEVFSDPRYARIDDKPAFVVYRASQLPDVARTLDIWRSEAARLGVGELHLARVACGPAEHDDPHRLGFDATVEFQPDWRVLNHMRLRSGRWWQRARRLGLINPAFAQNRIHDYRALVDEVIRQTPRPFRMHPGVTPRFDNTARRPGGNATILRGANPADYRRWLSHAVRRAQTQPDPVMFINSWNEWAEGAHLEPDGRWGRAWLDATAAVLTSSDEAA